MPIAASRPAAEPELVELSRERRPPHSMRCWPMPYAKVRERVVVEGQPVGRLFDREQRATHGLAWLATYVEAVRQLAAYAERMTGDGTLGELEEHLVRIGARRISRPDRRRHSDEPGRDRAAERLRPVGRAGRRAYQSRPSRA